MKPKTFSLMPEIQKTEAEYEKAQRRLVSARTDLEEAESNLSSAEERLAEVRQHIATARDNHGRPHSRGVLGMRDAAAHLEGLKARAREEEAAVEAATRECRSRRHRLRVAKEELVALNAKLRALDRLRRRREREWRKDAEREADNVRDDAAILSWNWKRRESKR